MTEIFLAAGALGLLAICAVVAVARRAAGTGGAESLSAVFVDRRRELRREVDVQGIEVEEAAILEEELALSHLDESARGEPPEQPVATRPPLMALWIGGACAVVVALGLYAVWGEPNAPLLARAPEIMRAGAATDLERLESVLDARIRRAEEDVNARFLLAHVRMQMSDYEGASEAFAELHELAGANVEVDLAWAHANYRADGQTLTSATRRIVDRVLAERPDHPSMLELLALDAIGRDEFAEAESYLARAVRQSAPSPRRTLLAETLAAVRQRLPHGAAPSAAEDEDTEATRPAGIALRVALDAALQLDADVPVFVIARDPLQPRPPVAVRRLTVGDLPAVIELTDADAMMPGRGLTDFEGLQVFARVSLGGTPSAQSGDLESAPVTTGLDADPVTLRIDRRVP